MTTAVATTTTATPHGLRVLGEFELVREDDSGLEGRLTDLAGDLGGTLLEYVAEIVETVANAAVEQGSEGTYESDNVGDQAEVWKVIRAYLCLRTLIEIDGEWAGLKMQHNDMVFDTSKGHACDVTPMGFNLRDDDKDGDDDDDDGGDDDDDDECMSIEEMHSMCTDHWNDSLLMDDDFSAAKDLADEHAGDLAKVRADGRFHSNDGDAVPYEQTLLCACVREYEAQQVAEPLVQWRRDPDEPDTLYATVADDWLRRVELVFKEELAQRSGTHAAPDAGRFESDMAAPVYSEGALGVEQRAKKAKVA